MSTILNFMSNIFAIPFGYILSFLYEITNNYVISLICITLFVKLCLLPIDIMKQKNNKEETERKAKIIAIKKKYPNNEEQAQQEINQLEEATPKSIKGFRVFTFFLQLFVLVGLLNVLNTPLTSILRMSETTVEKMETIMADEIAASGETKRVQIVLLEETANHRSELLDNAVLTEDDYSKILSLQEKFSLFGINLSLKAKMTEVNELWIFPLSLIAVMGISNIYRFIETRKTRRLKKSVAFLDYIPFAITAIYCFLLFMFPVGITFYFTISNIVSFVKGIILKRIFRPALPQPGNVSEESSPEPFVPAEQGKDNTVKEKETVIAAEASV